MGTKTNLKELHFYYAWSRRKIIAVCIVLLVTTLPLHYYLQLFETAQYSLRASPVILTENIYVSNSYYDSILSLGKNKDLSFAEGTKKETNLL